MTQSARVLENLLSRELQSPRQKLLFEGTDLLNDFKGDPHFVSAVCGHFIQVCSAHLPEDDTLGFNVTSLPAIFDVMIRINPSAPLLMLLKNLQEPYPGEHSIGVIQNSPDTYVSFQLARKLAYQRSVATAIQFGKDGSATLHAYFPNRSQLPRTAKDKPAILIIEDTKPIGMLMDLYLRQAGFRAYIAPEGNSGLKMARDLQPDMITLDVMMPKKDGWQVLMELKSDPVTSSIPVAIVSVLKDVHVGYEFGASDYIVKPVVKEDLVASTRRLTRAFLPWKSLSDSAIKEVTVLSNSEKGIEEIGNYMSGTSVKGTLFSESAVIEKVLDRNPGPALILVDCRDADAAMPACRRIRLFKGFDSVPVIALTGNAEPDKLRLQSLGLVDEVLQLESISENRIEEIAGQYRIRA